MELLLLLLHTLSPTRLQQHSGLCELAHEEEEDSHAEGGREGALSVVILWSRESTFLSVH